MWKECDNVPNSFPLLHFCNPQVWLMRHVLCYAVVADKMEVLPNENVLARGSPSSLAIWGKKGAMPLKHCKHRTMPFKRCIVHCMRGPAPLQKLKKGQGEGISFLPPYVPGKGKGCFLPKKEDEEAMHIPHWCQRMALHKDSCFLNSLFRGVLITKTLWTRKIISGPVAAVILPDKDGLK